MFETFFDHVNIPRQNIHILDGTTPPDEVEEHCRKYEEAIRRAGGIDVLLLGIGRNGHIGFNEPFSVQNSRTRLATLDPVTRKDAASDFFHADNVPTHALTMGIATIFEARQIMLLAFGEHKAKIIREAAEGPMTDRVPASFLREHPNASFLLGRGLRRRVDRRGHALGARAASSGPMPLVKRAVLWLCQQTGKALLKLDGDDFRQYNLHQLLRDHGPSARLAHRVFRWMMDTIEYHPGGREPRRVLCFSPHPDDDVISMGGTLIRLVEDQHEVHVAYMTSGNIAVFDHDARRIADLVAEFNRSFEIDVEKSPGLEAAVMQSLGTKASGDPDRPEVLRIKSLIRWSEAKNAAGVCGCKEENLHFLDLPFYQTGTIAKRPITDDDVRRVRELIERLQPDQVYVAGDLSDPHGTHRLCAQAVFRAIAEIEAETGSPARRCCLYRGAWQEWPLHRSTSPSRSAPKTSNASGRRFSATNRRKTRRCFPVPTIPASFGSGPKTATATRPTCSTPSACRILRNGGVCANGEVYDRTFTTFWSWVLGLRAWVGNFGHKAQYHKMVVRIELMWPYVFNSIAMSLIPKPQVIPKTQDPRPKT